MSQHLKGVYTSFTLIHIQRGTNINSAYISRYIRKIIIWICFAQSFCNRIQHSALENISKAGKSSPEQSKIILQILRNTLSIYFSLIMFIIRLIINMIKPLIIILAVI